MGECRVVGKEKWAEGDDKKRSRLLRNRGRKVARMMIVATEGERKKIEGKKTTTRRLDALVATQTPPTKHFPRRKMRKPKGS